MTLYKAGLTREHWNYKMEVFKCDICGEALLRKEFYQDRKKIRMVKKIVSNASCALKRNIC